MLQGSEISSLQSEQLSFHFGKVSENKYDGSKVKGPSVSSSANLRYFAQGTYRKWTNNVVLRVTTFIFEFGTIENH